MRTLKKLSGIFSCAALIFLVAGCASTGVINAPLNRERPITTEFDPDDARRTVEQMVDSMLQFGPLVELTSSRRPVMDIASVQNRTMQHIDTVSLTDSIRTKLLKTGKFRFTDRATSATDIEIINEQNELGLADKSNTVKAGQQIAAELYLYGAIAQIMANEGRTRDRYYKITMNLKDIKSGEIIWSDEKEIRKERTRAAVGL